MRSSHSSSSRDELLAKVRSSVDFDFHLAPYDLLCTRAHVRMLAQQRIIEAAPAEALLKGIEQVISNEKEFGLTMDPALEDVHMNVEAYVAKEAGSAAVGAMGAARSRNDLAVSSLRLWVRDSIDELLSNLLELCEGFAIRATEHADTVMPGLTHLQYAQPVTFGHWCLAYAEMLLRDVERFRFARVLLNECPLGAVALAGTSFPVDRYGVAKELGFDRPMRNSIDAVADRDFTLDFLGACSTLAIHLSRFAEDLVFLVSPAVGFIHLPDDLVGLSVIMPNKRNPDVAELVRAKCGRVFSNLTRLQTMLKGLPMAYCKDLQEDKEAIFDGYESLTVSLQSTNLLIRELVVDAKRMHDAAVSSYTTATDYADWLCRQRGIDFKQAHHLVCSLVRQAQKSGVFLHELSSEERMQVDARLGGEDWPVISPVESVQSRTSHGGTAPALVREAAAACRKRISDLMDACAIKG